MKNAELIEIVKKAQDGDDAALQALYLDSSKSVYHLALKILKKPNDAEDITQEVFITVQERISELQQPGAYYKWLNQVTANKCTDLLRKKRTIHMFDDEGGSFDFDEAEDFAMPDKAYDDFEVRQLIMGVVDALPDTQRVCVYYYYYQQLTISQIAENLGVNENTVKSRLALARGKIKVELERKERDEGIKLYAVPIALTPIFRKVLEEFTMPQGLSEQMWQHIAEATGSAAAGGGAAAAANEAAKAGAKEAVKQSAKGKVIGAVAGVAAVAVIATVALWPKPEEPAPEPSVSVSEPAPSSEPTSEPEPPAGEAIVWQDPTLEYVITVALEEAFVEIADGVTPVALNRITDVSIETNGASGLSIWITGDNLQSNTEFGNIPDSINLDDLKHFSNLCSFDLIGDIAVEGIDVLGKISSLWQIRILDCPSVTKLPDLLECELDSLELVRLPLTQLPHVGVMKSLIIRDCPINDLSPLANVSNLMTIELDNIPANDLSPIAGQTNLSSLYIIGLPVSDISSLSNMTGLLSLKIQETDISDITPLQNMNRLETANLQNNNIADVSALAELPALKRINLTGNPISDMSPLDTLSDVEITF